MSGQIAHDGTYAFEVEPGTYKVLAQYDAGGEQWRGPFTVLSALSLGASLVPVPYEDIEVVPARNDIEPPTFLEIGRTEDSVVGQVEDASAGVAVIEQLSDVDSADVVVNPFDVGAQFVPVSIDRGAIGGTARLRMIDVLGNVRVIEVQVGGATGVMESDDSELRLRAWPNPALNRVSVEEVGGARSVGAVQWDVFDVTGQHLRSESAKSTWSWDLRTSEGRAVREGVYFIRALRRGSNSHVIRVAIVR